MKMIRPGAVALIDGSPFLFIHGNNPQFKKSIRNHLDRILGDLGTDKYIGVLDGEKNFRKDIAKIKVYKGNRDKTDLLDRFPYFLLIKQHLKDHYGFVVADGIEADDYLGVVNNKMNPSKAVFYTETSTFPYQQHTFNSVICSIDKDLLTKNGVHYNFKKMEFTYVTKETCYLKLSGNRKKIESTGYKMLYAQCLLGDSADNIQGVPGYGPVKTYNTLKDCDSETQCKTVVKEIFKNKYGGLEEYEETLLLVTILENVGNYTNEIDYKSAIRTYKWF